MSEQEAIMKSKDLITKSYLIKQFKNIGLNKGDHILVHSSLSSLGWVCGGANAVIEALMEVISESGTITMPAHSGHLSEPSYWQYPPVPQEWWEKIREEMPAFCPRTTSTRGMGTIAETFRIFPNVVRSKHPQVSFASWGEFSEEITASHPLSFGLSETSPLGRLYETDAKVILLGVDYDSNTSFHLGEYSKKRRKTMLQGSPILKNGSRIWASFEEEDFMDNDDFLSIGKGMEDAGLVEMYSIGSASVKVFSIRDSVDFMRRWIYNHNL